MLVRVICFDARAPNVQHILRRLPRAKPAAARRPRPQDFRRLSSYGKFLMASCRARQTHAHYSYEGAFGLLLASLALWQECARRKEPMLVFEENSELRDEAELAECLEVFRRAQLDFLMLHTWGPFPDVCRRGAQSRALDVAATIASTAGGGAVRRLTWPHMSTKAYAISPRFAAHLVALLRSRIDNLHIDWLLCGEALAPSNRARPFRAALYRAPARDNGIVRVIRKPYAGIRHDTPLPNMNVATHVLQSALGALLVP